MAACYRVVVAAEEITLSMFPVELKPKLGNSKGSGIFLEVKLGDPLPIPRKSV